MYFLTSSNKTNGKVEKFLPDNILQFKKNSRCSRLQRWNAMREHTATQVANRLLRLAEESNRTLTPMQLIKLVYLCQGWMLGIKGRPLFKDPIEAWAYGPVIRSVYEAVRRHRDRPISEQIPVEDADFDADENDIIEQTFEQYGKLSGITLSKLTHQEGSPWAKTQELFGRNGIISNDLIQGHFYDLAHQKIVN